MHQLILHTWSMYILHQVSVLFELFTFSQVKQGKKAPKWQIFLHKKTGVFDSDFFLFGWFEELGLICELLEKASEIRASEIKSPTDRVFQKCVYTCFMVKMKIIFGSFGSIWVGNNAPGRISGTLNFGVL